MVKHFRLINQQNYHFRSDFNTSKIVPRILTTKSSVIFAKPLFQKHKITIDTKNRLLQLPEVTLQLTQFLPENGKKRYTKKFRKISLILTSKKQVVPQSQVILEGSLANLSDQFQSCIRLVIPSDHLEDKYSIALTSSLSNIDGTGKAFVSAINLSDTQITLNIPTEIAQFQILHKAQADNLIQIDPQLVSLAKMRNPYDF